MLASVLGGFSQSQIAQSTKLTSQICMLVKNVWCFLNISLFFISSLGWFFDTGSTLLSDLLVTL